MTIDDINYRLPVGRSLHLRNMSNEIFNEDIQELYKK